MMCMCLVTYEVLYVNCISVKLGRGKDIYMPTASAPFLVLLKAQNLDKLLIGNFLLSSHKVLGFLLSRIWSIVK